jgi:hypothetical protein
MATRIRVKNRTAITRTGLLLVVTAFATFALGLVDLRQFDLHFEEGGPTPSATVLTPSSFGGTSIPTRATLDPYSTEYSRPTEKEDG